MNILSVCGVIWQLHDYLLYCLQYKLEKNESVKIMNSYNENKFVIDQCLKDNK